MSALALIWGICAFLGFCVALIPCLGWLNWLNIPFAMGGLVVSILAMARAGAEGPAMPIAALVLNLTAILVGVVRLILGAGVF